MRVDVLVSSVQTGIILITNGRGSVRSVMRVDVLILLLSSVQTGIIPITKG
jgi:hypothetical protein